MADGGDGFEGRIAVVQRTRGYRRWQECVFHVMMGEDYRAIDLTSVPRGSKSYRSAALRAAI